MSCLCIHEMQHEIIRPRINALHTLQVKQRAEVRLRTVIIPHCLLIDANNLNMFSVTL